MDEVVIRKAFQRLVRYRMKVVDNGLLRDEFEDGQPEPLLAELDAIVMSIMGALLTPSEEGAPVGGA